MTDPDRDRLLARILGPTGPELTCEQCFAQLDRYVELELDTPTPTGRSPACGRISKAARPAPKTTRACSPSLPANARLTADHAITRAQLASAAPSASNATVSAPIRPRGSRTAR